MMERREGYQPINIAPADRFDDMDVCLSIDDVAAARMKPKLRPFAEVPDEDAIEVAQAAVRARDTIARDRDRLASENAALRERIAHLERKPPPRDWHEDSDWSWCNHLVDKRRAAEGADMLLPSHESMRLPLQRAVPIILACSVAAWLALVVAVVALIGWVWP